MENSLVSIIVPIYNVEKYLSTCINSILNQTYKNLEIILVDDGSTDDCPKICEKFANKDSRIKVIHKINGGLSEARNFGLEIASGDWISFVDSDDYVENNYIEALINSAIKNHTNIAQCNVSIVDENSEYISSWRLKNKKKVENGNSLIYNYLTGEKGSTTVIVVWNKLYKIDLLRNIRFPIGKINEDEFFTYKVFYNNYVSIIEESLYNYRQNSNGIMHNFNIKRLDSVEAAVERTSFYMEKKEDKMYKLSLLETLRRTRNMYKKIYVLDNKERKCAKQILNNTYINVYKNSKNKNILNKRERMTSILFIHFKPLYSFLIWFFNK